MQNAMQRVGRRLPIKILTTVVRRQSLRLRRLTYWWLAVDCLAGKTQYWSISHGTGLHVWAASLQQHTLLADKEARVVQQSVYIRAEEPEASFARISSKKPFLETAVTLQP